MCSSQRAIRHRQTRLSARSAKDFGLIDEIRCLCTLTLSSFSKYVPIVDSGALTCCTQQHKTRTTINRPINSSTKNTNQNRKTTTTNSIIIDANYRSDIDDDSRRHGTMHRRSILLLRIDIHRSIVIVDAKNRTKQSGNAIVYCADVGFHATDYANETDSGVLRKVKRFI